MIDRSSAYDQAVTARRRRITVRATFDLRDPDAVVSGAASSAQSPYSQIGQVYDEITDQTDFKLGTLEQNRIQLDGSWALPPDDPDEVVAEQLGWWGGVLSGADGTFSSPPYIELSFSGMSILQAFTLWFSQNSYDGVPESFRVDVYSAATLAFSRIVEGNADHQVLIEQFTVYDPTKIRITMLKWSRPYTYPRLTDLFFGLFEQWSGRDIYSVDVLTESTFTGLSLPYSTCDLEAYNKGHRFDPYAPNSLFLSIEERQAIPIDWGIYLPDGTIEWVPGGWYYQQSGGWEIKDITVKWSLVDIIGMLVDRNYSPPDTLPTTLGGWIASIVACLGVNLAGRYIVDDEVKDLALTAAVEDVTDKFCGDVLRYACMATAAWAHQDFETGYLRISKRGYDTGANITGSNMPSWPKMQANEEIADITFKLDEGEVTFPGTNTASDKSLTVDNPFVHTADDARRVVSNVMSQYGGRKFTVRSRGNPVSETGDIDTVATAFGTTISARRYKHQLKLVDGVMRNLPSYLIQTDTDKRYDHKVVLTGSGTWKAPTGVRELYVQLVGGGDGGDGGEGGDDLNSDGGSYSPQAGKSGKGGKVYIATLSINSGQSFAYSCGKGGKGGAGGVAGSEGWAGGHTDPEPGKPGTTGTATTFGAYSSANGKSYPAGITDVETGKYYAADGIDGKEQVDEPRPGTSGAPNTGNAGSGGDSGANGYYYVKRDPDGIPRRYSIASPKNGASGGNGADGVIIIQYNDP